MKVLVLSPQADLLIPTITACGDEAFIPLRSHVRHNDAVITEESWECLPEDWPDADFVVMFNYKHIVGGDALRKYSGRIINIHTSVLPYNRGANPNFWSWFDDTPKGVSIHKVDEGIDTGELLACKEIQRGDFSPPMSLHSTYNDLIVLAAGLFRQRWEGGGKIKTLIDEPTEYQRDKPTYHRSRDIEPFFKMLPDEWKTYVGCVEDMGKIYRGEICRDLK